MFLKIAKNQIRSLIMRVIIVLYQMKQKKTRNYALGDRFEYRKRYNHFFAGIESLSTDLIEVQRLRISNLISSYAELYFQLKN